jgi:hypothetical protein
MHVDKKLPQVVSDLRASRSFFDITGLDCSFLHHPADMWPGIASYQEALHIVTNIPCVNDCAERGVALIQEFNASVKHEDQRQFLLQVAEQHRRDFKSCDRSDLVNI